LLSIESSEEEKPVKSSEEEIHEEGGISIDSKPKSS